MLTDNLACKGKAYKNCKTSYYDSRLFPAPEPELLISRIPPVKLTVNQQKWWAWASTVDWGGVYEIPDKGHDNVFTYAACEQLARTWLEEQEDKK